MKLHNIIFFKKNIKKSIFLARGRKGIVLGIKGNIHQGDNLEVIKEIVTCSEEAQDFVEATVSAARFQTSTISIHHLVQTHHTASFRSDYGYGGDSVPPLTMPRRPPPIPSSPPQSDCVPSYLD